MTNLARTTMAATMAAATGLLTVACTAAPRQPTPAGPQRVVVLSDLNSAYGSRTYAPEVGHAIHHVLVWRPDFVLVAGDMIAGQAPHLADSTVRGMWQAFDSVVAAPLREARIPLVVTLGNHDGSAYPSHARDRRIAGEYWRSRDALGHLVALPGGGRDHYPYRYAVRAGDTFVAVWDGTNEESARDDVLLDWLRAMLQSADARAARHRIVLSHLPMFGIAEGRNRPGEVLADGDTLRRRLEEWGATLFVSGHHHAWYPAHRGSLGLLHAGALGEGPRPIVGDTAPPARALGLLELFRDSVRVLGYHIAAGDGDLSPIDMRTLPRAVCGRNGVVVRWDLGGLDTACTVP